MIKAVSGQFVTGQFVAGQFVADNSSRAIRRGQFVADNSSQNMILMLLGIFNVS